MIEVIPLSAHVGGEIRGVEEIPDADLMAQRLLPDRTPSRMRLRTGSNILARKRRRPLMSEWPRLVVGDASASGRPPVRGKIKNLEELSVLARQARQAGFFPCSR